MPTGDGVSGSVLLMRFAGLAQSCVVLTMWGSPASAYRPFDGTDAAVADVGELEIELQPTGFLKQGVDKSLIAPAWVVNIGLSKGWEAVFEGRGRFPLSPSEERPSLTAASAFLKGILREGSLQEKTGPSIATEFGVLLPGINADSGMGASVAGILSQRWEWTTIHLNVATALTRDRNADLFLGAIIEGPSKWKMRPVAEVFYENEFGTSQTISGLVGVIWQVNDNLSFDIGLRHAFTNRTRFGQASHSAFRCAPSAEPIENDCFRHYPLSLGKATMLRNGGQWHERRI